jgi:hypothetical protein
MQERGMEDQLIVTVGVGSSSVRASLYDPLCGAIRLLSGPYLYSGTRGSNCAGHSPAYARS